MKAPADMYEARRNSTNENFANARPVSTLNTDAREDAAWLSPDGCRLYFSRDNPPEIKMGERPK